MTSAPTFTESIRAPNEDVWRHLLDNRFVAAMADSHAAAGVLPFLHRTEPDLPPHVRAGPRIRSRALQHPCRAGTILGLVSVRSSTSRSARTVSLRDAIVALGAADRHGASRAVTRLPRLHQLSPRHRGDRRRARHHGGDPALCVELPRDRRASTRARISPGLHATGSGSSPATTTARYLTELLGEARQVAGDVGDRRPRPPAASLPAGARLEHGFWDMAYTMQQWPDSPGRGPLTTESGPPKPVHASETRIPAATEQPISARPLDRGSRSCDGSTTSPTRRSGTWPRELDVAAIDIEQLTTRTVRPRALCWSRRAGSAFADISESEAALVRCCIELDRAADLKYILAARGTERAVATDACHRIAQRISPATAPARRRVERQSLFTDRARSVERSTQRVDFDAYFVAHFVVLAAIDSALLEASRSHTTEPTCRAVLERIARRPGPPGSCRPHRICRHDRRTSTEDQRQPHRRPTSSSRRSITTSSAVVRCSAFLPDRALPGVDELIERRGDHRGRPASATAPLRSQRQDRRGIPRPHSTSKLDELGLEARLADLSSDHPIATRGAPR